MLSASNRLLSSEGRKADEVLLLCDDVRGDARGDESWGKVSAPSETTFLKYEGDFLSCSEDRLPSNPSIFSELSSDFEES